LGLELHVRRLSPHILPARGTGGKPHVDSCAMGASTSQDIGGVRVFKVSPGSPAQEAGLEVFFDFIVEINGAKLDPNSQQVFAQHIKESENTLAKMIVYNTRMHNTREVSIIPKKWAGNGLLGATVRYDLVDPAENHGIRVLEVFPNSPAAHAGLVPFQDFLLGTSQAVFHDIDELVEVVTSGINQKMQVYVYNSDSESVREVILVPNNDWGGDGCIGCDIGTGLLHRIPAPRRPPGTNPNVVGEGLVRGLPVSTYPPSTVPQQVAHLVDTSPPAIPTMPEMISGGPAAAVLGSMQGVAPGSMPSAVSGIVPNALPGAVPGAGLADASSMVPGGVPNVIPGTTPGSEPGITGVLGVPGTSGVPGISVPSAGSLIGGLPAISPSGSWAPMPAVLPQGEALGMPGSHAAPTTLAGAAALAQPSTCAVAGITWPPPLGQPPQNDDAATPPPTVAASKPGLSMGSTISPSSLVHSGPSASELPRAPPGTPLSVDDTPIPPVDISAAQDPSRFGVVSSPEPVPLL